MIQLNQLLNAKSWYMPNQLPQNQRKKINPKLVRRTIPTLNLCKDTSSNSYAHTTTSCEPAIFPFGAQTHDGIPNDYQVSSP